MRLAFLPMFAAAAGAMAGASTSSASLTVCPVAQAPDRYAGRRITIEGFVIVSSHGVHLLEPGCGYEINLVDSEADYPGRRAFRRLIRELRSERTIARLRVTGEYVDPQAQEGQETDDIFLSLIGPYLDLAAVEIVTVERLSSEDARRYQDWLREPGNEPFRRERR